MYLNAVLNKDFGSSVHIWSDTKFSKQRKRLMSLRSSAKLNCELVNFLLAAINAAVQAAAGRMYVWSMCCAAGAAVCAGHAGLACMRQLCGMKVMLWRSSAAERCSALEQQTPLFSCPDLCQLTLTLPLASLQTSMATRFSHASALYIIPM